MKCTCYAKLKPEDGLRIARDTIQVISPFRPGKEIGTSVLSGIAIVVTTALIHSVSVLIDTLNEESENDEESEIVSNVIEEGYGVLMDLASTCRFTNSAILSLDKKLFPSEDEMNGPITGPQALPSFELNGISNNRASQRALSEEVGNAALAEDEALGARPTGMSKWNSLLEGLQAGYGDLDTIPPTQCPGAGW